MRIAVFGVGAVGGYFGGRLAEAGEDVVLLARGATLEALRRGGLRIESPAGDVTLKLEVSDAPSLVGPMDAVILGVKAWQVPEAAEAIRPLVGPETFVVPLQNGVEAPDQLAAALGRRPVLGGLCRIFAFQSAAGVIRHAGVSPSIAFGELTGEETPRVVALREAFRRARGVTVETPADIRAALWEKFLFIVTLSGIGSVARVPVGAFRSVPETRAMIEAAMREVFDVARAMGIALEESILGKTMRFIDALPQDATSSMQRDVMEGRPSELEAQTGAVVRLGREAGIPTPANAFLYAALLPSELAARTTAASQTAVRRQ